MASQKTVSSADRRFVVLLALQGVTLFAVIGLLLMGGLHSAPGKRAQLVRHTAARLQAAGLVGEAITHYEDYLKRFDIDAKTRANVSYSLGQLYESQGLSEKALAWYYQVEGAAADSALQNEAAKKIVALLEGLGRHQAAKSVLSQAAALDKSKAPASLVVAQVGKREVSLQEVDAALDALPPQLKQPFEGKEGKRAFLKKYVADELLHDKARRLQYDSDPALIKQLEFIKKQYLVGRVVQEEVLSKVSVDERDLKNYYAANQAKYAQGKKSPPFDTVRQTVEQDYRMEKSQEKYQQLIDTLVSSEDIRLFAEKLQ